MAKTPRSKDSRLRLADHEDGPRMKSEDSDRRLHDLALLMRRVQLAHVRDGRRGIVVFEGWDAAGKGGAIKRITAELDPRHCKVWPIAKPTPEEQGRHYLYRFWQRLPERGSIAIFDRSWYGRVLVERVEGFATEREWSRAYAEINTFERMLIEDGVKVVKVFLHVSAAEQRRRFAERITDPYKRWKITAEDICNSTRRKDYVAAIEDMLAETTTEVAPWAVIAADDKHYARVEAAEVVSDALANGFDLSPPPIDPAVAKAAEEVMGMPVAKLLKRGGDGR
ncbi:MAG: polyphosphate kinase [Alphaproteobacteria bacterium]|nr:polyphosphate kinase [Alphaproteobacteria bacterium]